MLALPLYDDNPRSRPAVTTYGLIGGCVAVFLWQQGLAPRAAADADYAFGMIPAVLFGHAELPHRLQQIPAWASLLTSMFLHGGWLHLIGNMVYLWLFGRGVETALGSLRYLVFYLLCGVAAALVQAGMDPEGTIPMIGASGAIAGTLGAYLVLYPRANVVVLLWIIVIVRLIAVPAVVLLGLWFLMQLFSAVAATAGAPGVAFWAHVGGFVIGMLLLCVFRRPGYPLLQPRRSLAFAMESPRRGSFGRGSVPSAGRPPRPADRGW
jgi:rhomboid family protein